jgi:hypothetical protein
MRQIDENTAIHCGWPDSSVGRFNCDSDLYQWLPFVFDFGERRLDCSANPVYGNGLVNLDLHLSVSSRCLFSLVEIKKTTQLKVGICLRQRIPDDEKMTSRDLVRVCS